jgi:hypothetical protein
MILLAGWNGHARAQYGDLEGLTILKPEDKVGVQRVQPPEGALVLFDGKNMDGWVKRSGGAPGWKLLEGSIGEVHGGDVITARKFDGHFKLHVEFRVPYLPSAKGQARGNSGVYVQGRYEVQVLDSYGLQSKNNDCGAIYEVAAPLVNACKAPTVWQSYDIDFHAPKCQDGVKTEPARMTVFQNGIKIQDDVKIPVNNTRAGMGGEPCEAGPIMLQDHGSPVQYRNVWLLQLAD